MLTLKQIEVVRAIMISGTLAGGARLLGVSQPGLSRTMKHLESSLGIRLFAREAGRYVPAPEARDIFAQLHEVHSKLQGLNYLIENLGRGRSVELRIGSVPSIAQSMVPKAVAMVLQRFAHLRINIELLKIEEATDYLLLGRGEMAVMSYSLDHPALCLETLATGRLVCITAPGHEFAGRASVRAREIVQHPLIGIEPSDPYGRIMAQIFEREGLPYDVTIKARFGSTVCGLVQENLGIAVLDAFTVAGLPKDRFAILEIDEPTSFQTYIATRSGDALSGFSRYFITALRGVMQSVGGTEPGALAKPARPPRKENSHSSA